MKIPASYAGIVPDEKDLIKTKLKQLLIEADVIILTGGASAGDHDFVPEILQELGMTLHFSHLAIQPGKPVSFATDKEKICFGLSGNPVSSYLQFELLVKYCLYATMSHHYIHPIQLAPLAQNIERKKTERLKFFPVQLNSAGQAEEIKFNGSAHIAGLTGADGFGLFPRECSSLSAEEYIEILRIR
jgi:molybdopterin molybdotransferase